MNFQEQFRALSEITEKILMDFGISGYSTDGQQYACTGELLHSVLWHHKQVSTVFCGDHADEIISAIGDRTTKLEGAYPCIGLTSHATAGVLIDNLFFEFAATVLSVIGSEELPAWRELNKDQKQAIATLEVAERSKTEGWHELAQKVRTERILYLKSVVPEKSVTKYPKNWSDAVHWILAKHEIGEEKFRQSELTFFVYERDSQANVFPLLQELEGHGAIGPEHSGNYWKTMPDMNPLDSGGSEFTFAPDLRDIFSAKLRAVAKEFCSIGPEVIKPPWKPTDAQIQQVRDAIAGMKFKTKDLTAITKVAKMRRQRVSVILKMIGHEAD
jgi:hypothetical protein